MATEIFKNNAKTVLGAPLSNSATSLTLFSGSGALFPVPAAGQFFRISLLDALTQSVVEIVTCTARTGDVCTITRAQEGTTAVSWLTGDYAANNPTAGAIANLAQPIQIQSNQFVSSSAGGTADALTGTFTPAITSLTNGMALNVRAGSANATTTPTFSPNGLTPLVIVKGAGVPLAVGDIAGAGHWIELQYDQTLNVWVLLNPATGVSTRAANFTKSVIPAGSAYSTVVLTAAQSGSFVKLTNTYATLPALAQGLTYTFIGPGIINAGYSAQVNYPDNTISTGIPSISVGYGCSLEIGCDGASWFVYNMAGDVMLTAGSGLTHRAVRSDQVLGGTGTSYQNMTGLGGRALATNIYNGNTYPIEVTVTSTGPLGPIDTYNTISLTVGSETFNGTTSTSRGAVPFATVSAIVPAGVWYSVNSNYNLSRWSELR